MKMLLLSAFALLAAVASADGLYGVANDGTYNGRTSFVQIDPATGAAMSLFDFSAGSNVQVNYLAYSPETGHFYTSAFSPNQAVYVVDIDPVAQTTSTFTISVGLFEGIEYFSTVGHLAVSSSAGAFATQTLTQISPTGTVLGATSLPVDDADAIGIDPTTGDVLTFDTNNPTAGFSLNRIADAFGSPSRTGLYSGATGADTDIAAFGGSLYLANATSLYRFDAGLSTRTEVGPYGLAGRFVTGIAAVPEPATLLGLGLGGAALLRRRRLS